MGQTKREIMTSRNMGKQCSEGHVKRPPPPASQLDFLFGETEEGKVETMNIGWKEDSVGDPLTHLPHRIKSYPKVQNPNYEGTGKYTVKYESI